VESAASASPSSDWAVAASCRARASCPANASTSARPPLAGRRRAACASPVTALAVSPCTRSSIAWPRSGTRSLPTRSSSTSVPMRRVASSRGPLYGPASRNRARAVARSPRYSAIQPRTAVAATLESAASARSARSRSPRPIHARAIASRSAARSSPSRRALHCSSWRSASSTAPCSAVARITLAIAGARAALESPAAPPSVSMRCAAAMSPASPYACAACSRILPAATASTSVASRSSA
jgi:hypothetical protein